MGRAKPPLDLLAIGCSPHTGPNLNLGAVPSGREETWPRSSAATSMLCDLRPHSDLSVRSFCRSHIPVEAWGIYNGSSGQGVLPPLLRSEVGSTSIQESRS